MLKLAKVATLAAVFLAGNVLAVDYKVGVINTNDIMQHSSRVKAESQKLKDKFSKQSSLIEKSRKQLMADVAYIKKNSSILKKSEKQQKEQSLLTQEKELNKKQMEFSKAVMQAQQQVMQNIRADFAEIAKSLAVTKKLTLVLDQNGQVLYADPAIDLTGPAKKKFNNNLRF